jgi:cytochrome c
MNRLVMFSCISLLLVGCHFFSDSDGGVAASTIERQVDYIRAIPGENEEVSEEIRQKGKVLISYSDCYICHKEGTRARGPAFSDIALRYPTNEIFITILAQRVILGGTGAWGHSEMSPHPSLSVEDAQAMVSYILSFKEK